MSADILSLLAAIAGGVLPALAWLWFWLREDSAHPEPRRLIALAFFAGMCTVAITIPLEQYVQTLISNQSLTFTAWSAMEETFKFIAALLVILWRKDYDEPVDAVIYMICVALGFSAVENTLFLWQPLSDGGLAQTFITGNLRFVGATLLHVLSSATIGISLACGFYKPRGVKVLYGLSGVILAILLHATFNFLILNTPQAQLLRTFVFVWVGVVVLLAGIEFVKRIQPRRTR
ncbi:MAG TPA: PrsW family glutamic-type intramembrane protease [Candidatus Paceibacterota bacterium]|nr:PrsW family glutamic-type intramembrane protease [Candidatus Paceibacterota bacterium]